MTTGQVVLGSLSAAMDGGFTAIADVSQAMSAAGAQDDYRLIGGVTVMLHIERLGLDVSLRATADADFGVPPHVLRRPDLVEAIERLGYRKVFGTAGNDGSTTVESPPSTCSFPPIARALATPSRSGTSSRPRYPAWPRRSAGPAYTSTPGCSSPTERSCRRTSSYPMRSAPWR